MFIYICPSSLKSLGIMEPANPLDFKKVATRSPRSTRWRWPQDACLMYPPYNLALVMNIYYSQCLLIAKYLILSSSTFTRLADQHRLHAKTSNLRSPKPSKASENCDLFYRNEILRSFFFLLFIYGDCF